MGARTLFKRNRKSSDKPRRFWPVLRKVEKKTRKNVAQGFLMNQLHSSIVLAVILGLRDLELVLESDCCSCWGVGRRGWACCRRTTRPLPASGPAPRCSTDPQHERHPLGLSKWLPMALSGPHRGLLGLRSGASWLVRPRPGPRPASGATPAAQTERENPEPLAPGRHASGASPPPCPRGCGPQAR